MRTKSHADNTGFADGLRWIENEDMVISEEFGSEKPALTNYAYFMKRYPECHDFTYVGDNLKKDFIAPNALGWQTVCLKDDGRNIHKQGVGDIEEGMMPKRWMERLENMQNLSSLFGDIQGKE